LGLNCGMLTPVVMSSGHDGCADCVLESLNVTASLAIRIVGGKVSGQTGIELRSAALSERVVGAAARDSCYEGRWQLKVARAWW
jgi:hypothetical protein